MPLNEEIRNRIEANREHGSTPHGEIIRLERMMSQMQQMLIEQMQVNQKTLLQVNAVMRENDELRSKISIMERQIDFKQLQRLHSVK